MLTKMQQHWHKDCKNWHVSDFHVKLYNKHSKTSNKQFSENMIYSWTCQQQSVWWSFIHGQCGRSGTRQKHALTRAPSLWVIGIINILKYSPFIIQSIASFGAVLVLSLTLVLRNSPPHTVILARVDISGTHWKQLNNRAMHCNAYRES